MLPPLLAPVRVIAAPLSSSSEPAPLNEPENVVLAFPRRARRVVLSAPRTTVPPPDSALASTTAPLPSASVAPAPTLKAGLKADKLLVPPVIVKVAALPTLNEKAGAPAVKSSVLIVAAFEMVTAVGAPLLVKVAVPSGTVGEELQLVPVVMGGARGQCREDECT